LNFEPPFQVEQVRLLSPLVDVEDLATEERTKVA